MFKSFLISQIIFFLTISSLFADIVKKINITGNNRISTETIKIFSDVTLNSEIENNDLNIILKRLYDTNFFKDVSLIFSDGILEIKVIENPIVQNITFKGIKKKSQIEILNKIIILKEKSSFIETYAKKDLNNIKSVLKQSGYYFTEVELLLEENNNNTVNLVYDIELGKRASISKIKFVGNKKYKDRKLRNIIVSEESKFWKFLSNKKYLDEQRVLLDARLLKNFYLNKGFYNVKIESSTANFLDKNNFELVFNIDVGKLFTFNNFELVLPNDYDKKNFKSIYKLFSKLKSETYSYNKIEDILDEIDKISLSKQYQFIDASVQETIVDNNKINFSIIINETEKYYVERVNIFGNTITKEHVIRDTLIVDEGDAFNKILHNKSINLLKSKNIFGKVNSEIVEGTTENKKIINISIEEKATGELSAGAGIGTNGGAVSFSVKENNFQGKGIVLFSSLNITSDTILGVFSSTIPNYKYSNKDLITSFERSETDKLTAYGYKTSKTGFSLGTNFEQYQNFYFSPTISIYAEDLTTNTTASKNYKKQEGSYLDANFSYGLNYDQRNQRFQPSDGYSTYFSQIIPLVSDDFAILNGFEFNSYHELFNEMIGSFSFSAKAINSLSGDDVRVSKRLFMPSRKLRGFERGRIGPKDGNDYVGGNYLSSINLSTTLPGLLPTLQNTDFKLFFDAGNVWGVDYNDTLDESFKIRSATGIALDWFTPIGPLSFSFAYPITKNSTDATESFRFNLGTTF